MSRAVLNISHSVPQSQPGTSSSWALAALPRACQSRASSCVLRQRFNSSCMNPQYRAQSGLPPVDPKVPLLTTIDGDPIPLTVEQLSARRKATLSATDAPGQANNIAHLPPYTK